MRKAPQPLKKCAIGRGPEGRERVQRTLAQQRAAADGMMTQPRPQTITMIMELYLSSTESTPAVPTGCSGAPTAHSVSETCYPRDDTQSDVRRPRDSQSLSVYLDLAPQCPTLAAVVVSSSCGGRSPARRVLSPLAQRASRGPTPWSGSVLCFLKSTSTTPAAGVAACS